MKEKIKKILRIISILLVLAFLGFIAYNIISDVGLKPILLICIGVLVLHLFFWAWDMDDEY